MQHGKIGILKSAALVALCIAAIGMHLGCNLFDAHVKQMDLINGLAAEVTQRLNDGAMAQVHASGQAINPGITVEAAVKYTASARYDGLAGQFSMGAQGQLGERRMSDEVLAIITDARLSREARGDLFREILSRVADQKPPPESATNAPAPPQSGKVAVLPGKVEGD